LTHDNIGGRAKMNQVKYCFQNHGFIILSAKYRMNCSYQWELGCHRLVDQLWTSHRSGQDSRLD